MKNFFFIGLFLTILIKDVFCSGVFELKLERFENLLGRDVVGKCCDSSIVSSSAASVSADLKCSGQCLTSFHVCLKHYQVLVDIDSPCTYGDVYTPILGDKLIQNEHLLQLPFNFTWTGTFSLIVEAWHDLNSTTSGGKKLLARHTQQQHVNVGPGFVAASYNNHYTSLHYEYRVTCMPQYYGAGCEVFCRPRDDNFGHYVCNQDGGRECLPGWEGQYCLKPRCLPGCNPEHGQCSRPGECECKMGWTGERCDQCKRYYGCVHGTCEKPWECLCEEGWGGLFCNLDLNYCTNHRPCKNGGTCFNTGEGSYTCSCPEGYTGRKCETYLGHTLSLAQAASCSHLGCFNDGLCDLVTGVCNCPEGFTGSQCETAEPCARQPCMYGGVCEPLTAAMHALRGGERYRCKCPLGFSGPRCENRPLDCDAKQCLNGGQCVTRNGSRVCDCIDGYFGKFCDNSYSACKSLPCQNRGTCINLSPGRYQCICDPEYTGTDCETSLRDLSQISRQVSENGALLVSEMNGLSSLQIIVIVIVSVLIPLIALVGALTVIILRRRRELDRKKSDQLAKMENEANMITSGVKLAPENVMIHNMLRFSDTKFINNFEGHEYAQISHSVSDSFYESVPCKKPINTNRFSNKEVDKRLSRISIDSSSTSNTGGNLSCTYMSSGEVCKEKCGGPSTSSNGPIYQSASSACSAQSIYLIPADSSFQIDEAIVPPGFFATEV